MGESSSMPGKGTAYHSGYKAGAMDVKANVGGTPGYGAYPGLGYPSATTAHHKHYAPMKGVCPPVPKPVHCCSGRPGNVAAELVLFILLVIVIRWWQC